MTALLGAIAGLLAGTWLAGFGAAARLVLRGRAGEDLVELSYRLACEPLPVREPWRSRALERRNAIARLGLQYREQEHERRAS